MIQSVAMNQSNGFWVNAKRTLFMASLYFRLAREYTPDESILDECNKLFYLVNNPQSLVWPMMVCRRVWKDQVVHNVVEHQLKGRAKMAVDNIYGTTPRWLRYLDRETMTRDAEKVLRKAEQIHGLA